MLNVFKSMLTIDDILEKEDYYILDRLKQWLQQNAETNAAAKPVILLIERTVSCAPVVQPVIDVRYS